MKTFLALSLLLTACAANPPTKAWTSGEKNACVPEAAVMVEGLRGADIKAQVLLIQTPKWNHAVAVYLYPTRENKLWVWDANWKSIRVRAFYDDPQAIAKAWLAKTSQATLTSASFL